MKTIGLIGGLSWESTQEYYRIINQSIRDKLGAPHSAKCILYSVDFAEFDKLSHDEEWDVIAEKLTDIAKTLEKAGADGIVICTNTMHNVADSVSENINIPLVHIVDAVAKDIKQKNIKKVGLLGTKFTMEQDFYSGRLKEKHGIGVLIPSDKERDVIHQVIYKELVSGIIKEESRQKYLKIIENLVENGAEGIILGCTEIPLLIKQENCDSLIFDTSKIHAEAAVNFALKDSKL
ncbi:aspartate/glutamate racemase family protein [Methanococcus maripaludis]|uniref:Aspartate racemase n=1 Tax=Methanococcus maripaludis TaxID=39152 RepID=A0A8T4H3J5_METMI|nr:aspartate/glutamate racemase family protein [Methanococcus maripaludis]MBM7408808.1 aspartate racemase [Methanococcus maripaludis]MBP2219023.1 aspartate racemase [Methanococcus maripaludis]